MGSARLALHPGTCQWCSIERAATEGRTGSAWCACGLFALSICGCEADSHLNGTHLLYGHPAGLHLPGSGEQKKTGALVTVEDIVRSHWAEYGRNYYTRYDCEDGLLPVAHPVSSCIIHLAQPWLLSVLRR